MADLLELLSYGFIRNALIAGSFVAVLCSALGMFLVLRRLSLIGDGLAHATFGSVALALVLHASPLLFSIPVVMLSAVGIQKLTERTRVFGDAAIGIVSAVGIAAGVLLASMAGGFNVDLFSYLFGSILSIGNAELGIAVGLAASVILVIVFFYHDLFSTAFDPDFARVSGIRTGFLNVLFVLLTAITVVLAMRVVGIMLISALLILPPVTALQLARGFRTAVVAAGLIGVISVISGVLLSYVLNLPAGATIVILNFLLFLLAAGLRRIGRLSGSN